MNTSLHSSHVQVNAAVSFQDGSSGVPWLQLEARIREALSRRHFYIADSHDLSLLWRGERIDATERRRRITVFAAQHQWKVEARADGGAARFQVATASSFFSRENLSRNHE